MSISQNAVKSLKAYYESITNIEFSDSFVKNMIVDSSESDIQYLEEAKFHEKENLEYTSMETFYRENYVVNLTSDLLGHYDYKFEVLQQYLAQFKHIDELKDKVFLRENRPSEISLIAKAKRLTVVLNKGKYTENLVCTGGKDYLTEIAEFIIEKHKDEILFAYIDNGI